jgi:periplasmic protein TonB
MVIMAVVVGTDGKVQNIRVISAPAEDYAQSALEAARQWRFNPATCDGEAMEAEIGLEIEFNIH